MKNETTLLSKFGNAAKWSTMTELSTKLIVPITNMLLARLLAPEVFGVVTMVTIFISFTDLFTDAGFQKYLIQHQFEDDKDKEQSTNVAFWTNLTMSFILWIIIVLLKDDIASFIGNPNLGNVIAISCIQLPLTSFSSIQIAIYKREFNFKTLFIVRVIVAFIPLIVSVPLAFIGYGYWSIIIGTICGAVLSAIILTIKSKWKPSFFYSFSILKKMISFSLWSLFEALSIWVTAWIDVLIIGSFLSGYYVGLYTNSLNLVNALMAIITSSITPILFSGLSRLQSDQKAFSEMFLKTHKVIAFLVFPIGVGLFLYSDLVTGIMLGPKWKMASDIIGIWALTSAIRIVMTSIYSEAYRAKGMPKLSFFLQVFDLVFLIPICLISAHYGFWPLVYARAFMRFNLVIPGLIVMSRIIHISALNILKNLKNPIITTTTIGLIAIIFKMINDTLLWNITTILFCLLVYLFLVFSLEKSQITFLINTIKRRV
ncbi:lipopolysaccharide biosynthesis protein [Fictibacillus enclensis]|uniref:lipopolysaccharide biosynthesis protein n=1 Tax=Fictibacillus enclensis TaxID=1017270 RepID=UPI0025A2EA73|nr:lipopolysaccharide biosynthesis protein [Fictibacillus enclensis]MDM5201138.1 lipopolysaccharide biosynthesis protein [Fictibacillus enclensis]